MRGEKPNVGLALTGEIEDVDIKQASPIEQMRFLSKVHLQSEADSSYGFTKGQDTFDKVVHSQEYSPLVRLLAESFLTQLNNPDTQEENSPLSGYSRIVTPELFSDEIVSDEIKDLNEKQIKMELKSIEDTLTKEEQIDSYEDYISRKNELEYALWLLCFKKNQSKLHSEFPSLPQERQLLKIASDAAAAIDFEHSFGQRSGDDDLLIHYVGFFTMISDKNGHITNPSEIGALFGLEKDAFTYIAIVHNNNTLKNNIEQILGLSLSDLSIQSQAHLLKFMTQANNERFDRLCQVLRGLNNKTRLKLAENFLAADFGEDFGDSLLAIGQSERLSDADKERVFDTISSCRKSIQGITGLYKKFNNGQFAQEYSKAANERLTDALVVFAKIAEKSVATADLEWAGHPQFDYNTAIEALEYEAKSLEIINGTLTDVSTGADGAFAEVILHPDQSNTRLERTVYSFYSPRYGYVMLYTRPEGSHSFDPMVEYGKIRSRYNPDSVNAGVEASISLIVNPVDPFSLLSPFRPDPKATKNPHFYDSATMDRVSAIRLDREGRAPGAAANDSMRDPINPIGMISVDLAAIGDRADTPSGKIARLISVGGKIRENAQGTTAHLNHNTKWFSQETYGTAEGFRKIVEYMDEMVHKWCTEHGPDENDPSFRRLSKQTRGRKVRRVA